MGNLRFPDFLFLTQAYERRSAVSCGLQLGHQWARFVQAVELEKGSRSGFLL